MTIQDPNNREESSSTIITAQAELDYLAMKRENKNLNEENAMLQARLRQYVDQMASQVGYQGAGQVNLSTRENSL
jgi:hypothetical protein